jgi:hypothetical protein
MKSEFLKYLEVPELSESKIWTSPVLEHWLRSWTDSSLHFLEIKV